MEPTLDIPRFRIRRIAGWLAVATLVVLAGILMSANARMNDSNRTRPAPSYDRGCKNAAADAYARGDVDSTDAANKLAAICTRLKDTENQRRADAKNAMP